jgi:NADH-quinone oxidoreductase subunit M
MGIYPSTFIDMMSVSVDNLITNYKVALGHAGTAVAAR